MKNSIKYKQKAISTIKIFVLAMVLSVGMSYVFATTHSTPIIPLNTGGLWQEKTGGLTVNSGEAEIGLTVPFGRVGIGTVSPAHNLHILGYDDENAVIRVQSREGQESRLRLFNHNEEKIRLRGGGDSFIKDGQLGIGTTSPSQDLDVSGNTRLRGQLFDTQNNSGSVGQVLTRGSSGPEWGDVSNLARYERIGTSVNVPQGSWSTWQEASFMPSTVFMQMNFGDWFDTCTVIFHTGTSSPQERKCHLSQSGDPTEYVRVQRQKSDDGDWRIRFRAVVPFTAGSYRISFIGN